MKKQLKFIVNGNPYDIWIEPRLLLVQVLRDELGLKGTHRVVIVALVVFVLLI